MGVSEKSSSDTDHGSLTNDKEDSLSSDSGMVAITRDRIACRGRVSHLRLPEYDGGYDSGIFLTQVQKISDLNRWGDEELCANLMSSLKGAARDTLACFPPGTHLTTNKLVKALKAKFGKQIQSDVARSRLAELRQQRGQTIRQLGLEIEKLVGQAYDAIDPKMRKILATDAFMTALWESDVRLQVCLSQPKSLDAAIASAESIETAVRQARGQGGNRMVKFVNSAEVITHNTGQGRKVADGNGFDRGSKVGHGLNVRDANCQTPELEHWRAPTHAQPHYMQQNNHRQICNEYSDSRPNLYPNRNAQNFFGHRPNNVHWGDSRDTQYGSTFRDRNFPPFQQRSFYGERFRQSYPNRDRAEDEVRGKDQQCQGNGWTSEVAGPSRRW